MKIRIHRGAAEIGGNCVELQTDGASILLDIGEPLMGDKFGKDALPDIAGLTDGSDPNLLGIVISHPHLDHYGLAPFVSASIPKFIGREADTLLRAASAFTPFGLNLENVTHFRDKMPLRVGPFLITPYLADHSAFDSYSLLVEAGGKRIFYSGDLRAHGWKAWAFQRLVNDPPKGVDALILEGTTLSRGEVGPVLTESDLVETLADKIGQTDGIVLAGFSGQNIDRFVTFYKATRKAGRIFVADCYIAHLLHSLGRSSLPDPITGSMRVFLPERMKRQIVRNGRFDVVEPFRRARIFPAELLRDRKKLVVSFRASMADEFQRIGAIDGGRLIYSMWPGYLETGQFDLRGWCDRNGTAFDVLHTSGHASSDDLSRVVQAIAPRVLIPIHTLAPDKFDCFGFPVSILPNGQWHTLE